MNYTHKDLVKFQISEFIHNQYFVLAVTVLIVSLIVLALVADYKNNGPLFSDKKFSFKSLTKLPKSELYALICVIFAMAFVVITTKAFGNIPSPDAITQKSHAKTVLVGKVKSIDDKSGKLVITAPKRDKHHPIIAFVNNARVMPMDPLIPKYGGTTITNDEMLKLSRGDKVKIKFNQYEWKYKNHDDFGDDKNTAHMIKLLNDAKVNGQVEKINK
ncbi:hypothetical protein ACQW5G_04875 [Fructilactobacillus sp. Tb1]|uniref:hypothetical protein n=1 Tax=Fructilactobacillus sp. Tb1 TaxID=3422304 RepID=UPI003D2C9D94